MDLALLASHPDNKAIMKAYETSSNNLRLHNYKNTMKRISGGTVIRDELFEFGYLSDYSLLNIDTDGIVRMRHTQAVILKMYDSFNFENNSYSLLPCIKEDYYDKLLFTL